MDTMRSLNRSLPHSSSSTTAPPSSSSQPPEALLQSFKDAALSVTKLYKEAAATHFRARQAGYQDALHDLLSFLDREDLGLDDGEGWRVRQWATERVTDDGPGVTATNTNSNAASGPTAGTNINGAGAPTIEESDEEGATAPKRADSPTARAEQTQQRQDDLRPSPSPTKRDATPIEKERSGSPARMGPPRADTFSFRASPPASMELDNPAVVRVTPSSRRRGTQHHAHHRQGTRERNDKSGSLGPGGGTKRKVAMAEFWDLSDLKDFEGFGGKGFWNGKDAGGGGGGAGATGGGKRTRIN